MAKVVYAQVSFIRDFEPTLENLKSAMGRVDASIVVEADSAPFTEDQRRELKAYATVVLGHWGDNFPAFRNRSLEEAKKLGADWVIISDADEHFGEEFWRDLKDKIIPGLEKGGFNQAGIRCFDDFEATDWLDDLDRLKELPGGSAHETTWYKNLLFRLYPDVNYEGSGGTIGIGGARKNSFACPHCGEQTVDYSGKNEGEMRCLRCETVMTLTSSQALKVHEIWGSTSHPWVTANLPDPYHYVHRKSALRIWHNAARNLFIGGGGDTVGTLNPMWVELRDIASKTLGIDDWHTFEKYVTEKKPVLPSKLVNWIDRALVFSATDYGTETRETAKWMVWHHRELLNDFDVKYGIEHPPKPDERTELENYVRKLYFQVLGRHPDRAGLDNYVKEIQEGRLPKARLPTVLMKSPEYQQKFGKRDEKEEKLKVQLPIDVNITLSEEVLSKLLVQSRTFTEVFKPRMDVGRFVELNVSKDFWQVFYEKMQDPKFTFEEFVQMLGGYHQEKMITGR